MPEGKPPKKNEKGKILGLPYWAVGMALVIGVIGYFLISRRPSKTSGAPALTSDNSVSFPPTPDTSGGVASSTGITAASATLSPSLNAGMASMLSGLGMDPNQAAVGATNGQPAQPAMTGKQAKRAWNRARGVHDSPPYTNSKYQPGGKYYNTGLGRDPNTGRAFKDNPNWKP